VAVGLQTRERIGTDLGQDRIDWIGRRRVENIHLTGPSILGSLAFLNDLSQQHLEWRQDTCNAGIEIAAVHAEVIDADN